MCVVLNIYKVEIPTVYNTCALVGAFVYFITTWLLPNVPIVCDTNTDKLLCVCVCELFPCFVSFIAVIAFGLNQSIDQSFH